MATTQMCLICQTEVATVPCLASHEALCRHCLVSRASQAVAANLSLTCPQCDLEGYGEMTGSVAWSPHYSLEPLEYYGNIDCFPAAAQRQTCSVCLDLVAVVTCSNGCQSTCRYCFIAWYRASQEITRARAKEDNRRLELCRRHGIPNIFTSQPPLPPCPNCPICRAGYDTSLVESYGNSNNYRNWLFTALGCRERAPVPRKRLSP